jgi:phosphohistidine phosphatase SixA
MVVGHDPSMTEFVNRVLSGGAPLAAVEMKKGGVAKVDIEIRRQAVLRWCITPKVVQKIQRSSAKRSRPKTDLK